MIKVLQFVEGLGQGGIESFVTNVYQHLDKSKIRCDFLVLKSEKAAGYKYVYDTLLETEGAKIYYLLDENNREENFFSKTYNYIKLLTIWLNEHAKEYEVVHIHASHLVNFYPFIIMMKRAGIERIILHSHNTTDTSGRNVIIHKVLRNFVDKEYITRLACGVQAGMWMYGKLPFEVIANGIDCKKFAFSEEYRRQIREELNLDNTLQIFGHVGAFRKQKNHTFLIEVFEKYLIKHRNAVLLLVGEGEKREQIQQLIAKKKMQESVYFLGNRNDIYKILSALDCFLFPSLFEGLSVAAVEVQANGLPMIMSDTISQETIMCNNVSVCPIGEEEKCVEAWVAKMEEVVARGRKKVIYKSAFASYDILASTRRLEQYYENASENK